MFAWACGTAAEVGRDRVEVVHPVRFLSRMADVTIVCRGGRAAEVRRGRATKTSLSNFDLSPRSVGGANPNALIRIP